MEFDESLLASVVIYSHDAILSKTLDGVVTSWNHSCEVLYGYTAEEVIGKPIFNFIPEESKQDLRAALDKVSRGIYVEHFNTPRVRKDGTSFISSLTISPIKNDRGEIVASSSVVRDVTKSIVHNAELMNSMLDSFEALRTTLNVVIPLAQELSSNGLPTD